ncbi:MAG: adenosine deaminase [Verrucomicrobiae bacterium]|nr:adenosine deaminase [Verrucomicrobiae bacterium]
MKNNNPQSWWKRFRDKFKRSSVRNARGRRDFLGKGFLAALGSGVLMGSKTSRAAEENDTITRGLIIEEPVPSLARIRTSNEADAIWEDLKRQASPEDLYRFLYALPKGGDIHHHLGGGLLPEMIYEVATNRRRNGGQTFYARTRISTLDLALVGYHTDSRSLAGWVTIAGYTYDQLKPSLQRDFKKLSDLNPQEKEAWMKAMFLDNSGEGRDEFFEYIWNRLGDILESIDVMTELLVENMKRFGAEGVRYLEIQSRFRGWRDAQGGVVSDDDATRRFLERFEKPDAKATGVLVRFQSIVLRFDPDAEQRVEEYFEYTYNHPELWLGINMAGREDDNRGYPSRFTDVFDRMLRKFPGVGISIHAGEAEKKDTHIFDTLRLGATRIGHGINLIRDPQTMQMMRGKDYLIEINLISNHLLGYVPNLDEHPFPVYLRQGIPCCLNTDDRGMWHSNMTDEYFVAVSRFNLSWKEVVELGENSLQYSFLDDVTKRRLLQEYRRDVLEFQNRMQSSGWKPIAGATNAVTYQYGKKHLQLNLG